MTQKRGLGKGLGALIPTAPPGSAGQGGPHTAASASARWGPAPPAGDVDYTGAGSTGEAGNSLGAHFAEIPVAAISPNPRQPRQVFDEEALEELAASIRVVGLLQPVVVRATGPASYEIVMGERRWRACLLADLAVIPAIVRDTADTDMLRDALIENLHRQQLNPLEEAAAFQQLLDDFAATHEELAQRIGRSRPHISNTIRLLNLPPAVQRRVAAGVLSAGHARALLAIDDPAAQDRLAQRIVAEGLSVRATEEIVALGAAPAREPRKMARQPVAPGLKALADRLSDIFETRVKVELGQRKGKIVVEFASFDDLERIIKTMSPDAPQVAGG